MNYADIKDIDIQDGYGVRTSLYVSGCHFHCPECHNKEAWDFNYGKKFDDSAKERIFKNLEHDYIEGLSILGGEPFEKINQQTLAGFVSEVKAKFPNKSIWCWTGYDFDKDILNDMYKKYDYTKELLNNIDIIVDGQFEIDKHIVDLKFRGSYNQRKIDVQASIKQNKMVRLPFGDEERYEEEVKKTKIYKEIATKEKVSETINSKQSVSESTNGKIITFIPETVGKSSFIEQEVTEQIAAKSNNESFIENTGNITDNKNTRKV